MTPNRLKILMDKSDLKKFNISFLTLDYKSKKTREVFWEVINIAKFETGFDPSGSKLLIEAFPEKDGGLSLYVTKLAYQALNEIPENSLYNVAENLNTYIFRFDSTDDILDACKLFLKKEVKISDSRLFEHEGAFYLIFDAFADSQKEEADIRKLVLNLSEYGSRIINKGLECYLAEHANILIEESAIHKMIENL